MSAVARLAERSAAPVPGERRIHVVQGEFFVTRDANVVLTTILGSCVSACMRDPVAGVGGMNHFLLPEGAGSTGEANVMQQGVHAMELLVNGLLGQGARRDRLEAKLFGGACVVKGLSDIGEKNASFAEQFLKREGIRFGGGSLRGPLARRIQFWPVSGRARALALRRDIGEVVDTELHHASASSPATSGDIELF